ncbi:MAG: hypothetical protein HY066_06920 [Betaproteobacteria bacterium]|nr:hypothetical protein [Betaproteobacteria bacterium]
MLSSKPFAWIAWVAQGLLYALFALGIATFSSWPHYRQLPAGQALIKLSFTHTGKRVADCVQRTPAELAKLSPNMRAPLQCPRERSPVIVEVDLDGTLAYRHVAEPSGLSRDGASTVYRRLQVPADQHRLAVRLKDNTRSAGFDYNRTETLTLKPGQILVIDFDAEKGQITFI